MAGWTHNICAACWENRSKGGMPVRVVKPDPDTCCFCGKDNQNGIYVRDDPKTAPCKGVHKDPDL